MDGCQYPRQDLVYSLPSVLFANTSSRPGPQDTALGAPTISDPRYSQPVRDGHHDDPCSPLWISAPSLARRPKMFTWPGPHDTTVGVPDSSRPRKVNPFPGDH